MGVHRESIKLAIKDDLLGWFKTVNAKEGDMLSPEWLYDVYLPTLRAKEQKAFEEAIGEMIVDGIVGYVSGRKPTYRLTKKGEESMCYPFFVVRP
ncbi:MAG: hypothetical protein KJ804_17490 [Proteobacteria bacterium]|nr:hypothetical protein [Pseudomonadota bacterium]MBU1060101.1 hypothetical protein [Pseudomonadota bacterium]